MGCCGGGHSNLNQMRETRTHGGSHNQQDCSNGGNSRMMIVFALIVLASLAFYLFR